MASPRKANCFTQDMRKEPLKPHKKPQSACCIDFWTRCFLPQTVHDSCRGGHLGSHRLHLCPLGGQVSSFKGAIQSSSLPALVALGLTQAATAKLLTKLSRHAVRAAQAIVRTKRELEQELWSSNEQHEGRQGVG